MASIGATLKHLVTRTKHGLGRPKMDSIDEEDIDSPLTPKTFEDSFLKVQQELLHLKDQISHHSKSNFRLEKDLRFLDSKIALLINHKITIEELENRVFDDNSLSTFHAGNKKDLKHTELYGQLFFLLQTTPEYIAHLTRHVSLREIDGLLQIVMFTLYGNQYENREEHLLLSMFEHALTYEVRDATEINSLMRANTAITRMMTTYCRRGPGQEYVKSTLGEVIRKLIAYDKSLEVDPLRIFQEMIDNDEVERPAEDKLLIEAETNPTVRRLILEHVPLLQDFVLQILKLLKETINNVPFGIRWLCKATWSLVHEKFPDTQPDTLNALIGGFFFLRYINPIIATPYACRLVCNPPPSQARRNLTLVAKVIQKLASTSSVDVRESYMKPLEVFVRKHHEGLKTFLSNLCEVNDFHESLQLEEYVALCRNDICIDINISEISLLHNLLLKYQESILLAVNDPMSELLKDIPEPTDSMMKDEHTSLTLDLIHNSTSATDLPCSVHCGVSLNFSDNVATTRRQCKHLLIQLFAMAPHCLQEKDLVSALLMALSSPLEDVVSNAKLTQIHIKSLDQLGGLVHQGVDLYQDVKNNFPEMSHLLMKAKTELKSLRSIHQTMEDHTHYLREQLDAYKEYLVAVRTKVGGVQGNNHIFRKSRTGIFRFSHQQLEKEGVILETTGIPVQRRRSISYNLSCPDPGTYIISMYYKGHQKAIYEKNIHLEDLLELQHLQDPVIDMEGFVVLNVRRTLLLLNRHFMKRETNSRPLSRHFSTSALTLSSTKISSNNSSSSSSS